MVEKKVKGKTASKKRRQVKSTQSPVEAQKPVPVTGPEAGESQSDVCPKCNGKGIIEYEGGLVQEKCDCGAISLQERIEGVTDGKPVIGSKPPRSSERCGKCHDTGFLMLGNSSRRFCPCGQETREERLGIIPRRPHLGPAGELTDAERAEAAAALSGARQPAGGNLVEDTVQPGGADKPETSEGVSEGDGEVLPPVGDGVSLPEGDKTV